MLTLDHCFGYIKSDFYLRQYKQCPTSGDFLISLREHCCEGFYKKKPFRFSQHSFYSEDKGFLRDTRIVMPFFMTYDTEKELREEAEVKTTPSSKSVGLQVYFCHTFSLFCAYPPLAYSLFGDGKTAESWYYENTEESMHSSPFNKLPACFCLPFYEMEQRLLFEECTLKGEFLELRCFDIVMIAEAACYYMVHTLKPCYSELSISQQEREVILNDKTLNKRCCVCRRGLELEITHRTFPLFDGNTIPHNQHTTFPPMERDNVKWWLWKQLTTLDLSLAARRWFMGKEY